MTGSSPHILVLHGPNLNLLGSREPGHYGQTTLAEIDVGLQAHAQGWGWQLRSLQSNAEHILIDAVQEAVRQGVTYIIINPAAFTHTSVALRDALAAAQLPFIEVHLSNIHAREPFRQHSYFSDLAQGVIAGLGADGYFLALDAIHRRLKRNNS
ncbi:MAG: type II 3-dehydroquinate dehydratase [Acidithiobacillus ferrivorans]